jgi:hypothetical protein
MMRPPYQLSRAEWYQAYSQLKERPVQVKFTRAGASQAAAEFASLEGLRFGARDRFSKPLKEASKGQRKLSSQRAHRLLGLVQTPIQHRDVVVTALKAHLEVPEHVLQDYPELARRTYRRRSFD